MIQTQFTAAEREALCDALGDSPFTVISTHDMRHGSVNMALIGTASDIRGLAVQQHDELTEPLVFGDDIAAMIKALSTIEGWTCVNVEESIASDFATVLGQFIKRKIRFYGDWYYVLNQPVSPLEVDIEGVEIRLLKSEDIAPLTITSKDNVVGWFGNGVTACAMKEGQVLAMAHLTSISERYGNIGVFTNSKWRKRGLSTAVAGLVAHRIQEMGLIPVWSTGEDNFASQRVAQKLGMTDYGKRMYLILE